MGMEEFDEPFDPLGMYMMADHAADVGQDEGELLRLLMQHNEADDPSTEDQTRATEAPMIESDGNTTPEAALETIEYPQPNSTEHKSVDIVDGSDEDEVAEEDDLEDPVTSQIIQSDIAPNELKNSQSSSRSVSWAGTGLIGGQLPGYRIEVRVPMMKEEERQQYEEVRSEVVEEVIEEKKTKNGKKKYVVQFTDGRVETLSPENLNGYMRGEHAAITRPVMTAFHERGIADRKRKRGEEDFYGSSSDGSSVSEDDADTPAEDDDDDDEDDDESDVPATRRKRPRTSTKVEKPARTRERVSTRPSRGAAQRSIGSYMIPTTVDDSDDDILPEGPRRVAPSVQPLRRSTRPKALRDDEDELAHDQSMDPDEDNFMPVVSDVITRGRPPSSRPRGKRLMSTKSRASGQESGDGSSIRFEPTRRSSRAGKSARSYHNYDDDEDLSDSPPYAFEAPPQAPPKILSVREKFKPQAPDSEFAMHHSSRCHVCKGKASSIDLIGCQGCSLSYHKVCLGLRSSREHLVTKVGEDDFVLQCKFCIGWYRKKDDTAPHHEICQDCTEAGKSCAVFSERKTARQEEKLREANDGIDPIWPVPAELINNALMVMFRCIKCHRAWHFEHLPPARSTEVTADVRSERLKDYSLDWQCNECHSMSRKIDKLVAWRPTVELQSDVGEILSTDLGEDQKEYLVKWDKKSYGHVLWRPGAWVWGVIAAVSRKSFERHDIEKSLLHMTIDEAVPDEYLMPDVVLQVHFSQGTPEADTKEDALANIDRVRKMFVKFQGLPYSDTVWDSPPKADKPELYQAFQEAYYDYVEGEYFEGLTWKTASQRLTEYRKHEFEEVDSQPASMRRGKLMQYQIEGLNWLLKNFHAKKSVVLADEMGLGKTVQVVSLVTSLVQDRAKVFPFLIVVPNATCPNWKREFRQWAPSIRCVTYHGGQTPQELAYKHELFPDTEPQQRNNYRMRAHVVIMSFDSAADPSTKERFKHVKWAGLVVDEGQRLKNDRNLLYLALRALNVPFRLLLTGTPLQNNKRELFNLLQFIDDSQNAEELDKRFEVLDKETLPQLHEMIRPYFLRRTKLGVLKFLPAMAQIILPVSMTRIQEKLSRSIIARNADLIKAVIGGDKMKSKDKGSLNNIFIQLRKCLCHPFMYSEAVEEKGIDPLVMFNNMVEASPKLVLLKAMLPKLKERGHRVLIFSQFLMQLDILEDFLTGMEFGFRRLDGGMSSLEKQRRIDAFNAPGSELFAFLLSTRAGGVGINLATADTVIIMDPDFNPHQDLQALSRAHRIGQKKKVLCIQLVTKDSVEERIMEIGRKKMALDHALIESMDDEEIDGNDLESILKHGAAVLFDEKEREAIQYDAAAIEQLLDRSEIEETQADADGNAEAQFSHARVWSNKKAGFEAGLSVEEDEAPEPIASSVWDSILAAREEEAKREAQQKEAEFKQGRRKRAVNYKTNAATLDFANDDGGNSSDDSADDFEKQDSDEDSDEEMTGANQGKRRKSPHKKQATPPSSQRAKTANSQKSSRGKHASPIKSTPQRVKMSPEKATKAATPRKAKQPAQRPKRAVTTPKKPNSIDKAAQQKSAQSPRISKPSQIKAPSNDESKPSCKLPKNSPNLDPSTEFDRSSSPVYQTAAVSTQAFEQVSTGSHKPRADPPMSHMMSHESSSRHSEPISTPPSPVNSSPMDTPVTEECPATPNSNAGTNLDKKMHTPSLVEAPDHTQPLSAEPAL